jgi:hypothetical protein
MPLVPMAEMPNQDEQLRALNFMGSYANLSPVVWNGESGNLGFYEENSNHLSSLFSFGGSKKKKKDDSAKDKDKKPATPSQKQPEDKGSGLGGMTTYLIYGSVALAGAFVIYSLMKKKKEEPKQEVKQIQRRPYRQRTKPVMPLVAQGV